MDSRKLCYSLMMLMTLVAFGTIEYYFFRWYSTRRRLKNWKPLMLLSLLAKQEI